MITSERLSPVEGLDLDDEGPTLDMDPEEARRIGYRLVDMMVDHLRGRAGRPVVSPVPPEERPALRDQPLPQGPRPYDAIIDDIAARVLPHDSGNTHPRWWAACFGGGHLGAAFADFVASAMDSNSAFSCAASVFIEQQVLDWLKELLGYPLTAGGVLVSGGTVANMIGLQLARDRALGGGARREGLTSLPRPLVLYASDQVHTSVVKGVETLGLGSGNLRLVPSDAGFRIDTAALRRAIAEDRQAGRKPCAILGHAATSASGAIDPLAELAAIAHQERLWFHVDAATAGSAHASPRLRSALHGMDEADSIGMDLHKWMSMPYDVGCVLARDPADMQRSFGAGGNGAAPTWAPSYGLQGSRQFRALKVWVSLQQHGAARYARIMERCHNQALYLARLVARSDRLELMAPVTLNVVCFRYRAARLDEPALSALNRDLLARVQASGLAYPSGAELRGRFAIRASLNNHRTRKRDVEALVELVERLGDEAAG